MKNYQLWKVYYDKEMVCQFLIPAGKWIGEEHYKKFLPEGSNFDAKVVLSYSGSIKF